MFFFRRPEFGDDEDEYTGPESGLRRGQYPIFFGKQDPVMLKRVEEARYVCLGVIISHLLVVWTSVLKVWISMCAFACVLVMSQVCKEEEASILR